MAKAVVVVAHNELRATHLSTHMFQRCTFHAFRTQCHM
eukprot:COSAG01_NODE_3817_length_5669_cov_3.770916_5_plen_38_part_00